MNRRIEMVLRTDTRETLGGGNAGTLELFSDNKVFKPSYDKLKLLSDSLNLSEEDRLIINEILCSLKDKNTFPFDWSIQEANYLINHTEETWVEYIIYRFKFSEYPKRKIETKSPIYIKVEPVSSCNLRCVMCFQVDKTFTKKPFMGAMDFELFKKIIDDAEKIGTKAITLGSRGEPTLHPMMPEMLAYMKDRFIEVKLITNATRLTEKLAHSILENNVNIVVYSIDADEKKLYERIRVRGKFEEVFSNIKKFNEIRAKFYPNSKIMTRISGVKFDEEQNIDRFIEFWKPHVDEVGMKVAALRWNTYENEKNTAAEKECLYLWQNIYIWFDGKINPCDSDYKSYLSPGSLDTQTISEVWNGEEMKKLRNIHLNGGRKDVNPCDRCGVFCE